MPRFNVPPAAIPAYDAHEIGRLRHNEFMLKAMEAMAEDRFAEAATHLQKARSGAQAMEANLVRLMAVCGSADGAVFQAKALAAVSTEVYTPVSSLASHLGISSRAFSQLMRPFVANGIIETTMSMHRERMYRRTSR